MVKNVQFLYDLSFFHLGYVNTLKPVGGVFRTPSLENRLTLIDAGGRAQSSSSIGESRFLHTQISGGPETSL